MDNVPWGHYMQHMETQLCKNIDENHCVYDLASLETFFHKFYKCLKVRLT